MIEVMGVKPRPHTDKQTGETKFFFQKVKVTSVDRDGHESVSYTEVLSNPDAVLEAADDYIIDPVNPRIEHYKDQKGYDRSFVTVAKNARLIRIGDFIARETARAKAA